MSEPLVGRHWRAKQVAVEPIAGPFRREGISSPFLRRELSGRIDMPAPRSRPESIEVDGGQR